MPWSHPSTRARSSMSTAPYGWPTHSRTIGTSCWTARTVLTSMGAGAADSLLPEHAPNEIAATTSHGASRSRVIDNASRGSEPGSDPDAEAMREIVLEEALVRPVQRVLSFDERAIRDRHRHARRNAEAERALVARMVHVAVDVSRRLKPTPNPRPTWP